MSIRNNILSDLMNSGVDFFSLVISKEEILSNDTKTPTNFLHQFLRSPIEAKYFKEKIEVSISGYDNHRSELWEIIEVRNYIVKLDEEFPYWLYFLSKHGTGLSAIIRCFLLPFLTNEAEKTINLPRLQEYLSNRGFPAMNHICDFTNESEEERIRLTDSFIKYFIKQ